MYSQDNCVDLDAISIFYADPGHIYKRVLPKSWVTLSSAEYSNSKPVIFKISKSIRSSLNQFHLSMKTSHWGRAQYGVLGNRRPLYRNVGLMLPKYVSINFYRLLLCLERNVFLILSNYYAVTVILSVDNN